LDIYMTSISENENIGAVLVCGGGIAGIQASLDLAGSGFKVYLLDAGAAIGGRMAQLDKTFPTGDCAMCILSPKLVECARNRNIEIITLADIQSVSGQPGSFKVKIRQNPRYVDVKKCDACGDCTEACPVSLPNEFDGGLSSRKAIFQAYPQSIPSAFSISKSAGPAPCKAHCPAGINVPGSIALISAGKIPEAYNLIRERCFFPASTGRICRRPCELSCNRKSTDEAVSFGNLERFVGDFIEANPDRRPSFSPAPRMTDARVAVIGGGPAGLTAAADLALMGYGVTLFEAKPNLGGMLRYGIPAYRLPKNILHKEIQSIIDLGIEIKTETSIARPEDLLKSAASTNGNSGSAEKFNAVFVATGAWAGRKLAIPGEDAEGVLDAVGFLGKFNAGVTPKAGRNILVIGGSDLALDTARCARRLLGVKSVHIACMESRAEMPAPAEQIAQALEEGVVFHFGVSPTSIEAKDEKVASVVFRACTSVYDVYRGFKRYNPLFDDSQVTILNADTVVVAVGRRVDASRLGLETRPGGRILADADTLATSIKGIFAGGDAALGAASAVDAIAQGHLAAESIDAYIRGAANIRSTEALKHSEAASLKENQAQYARNPRPDAPRRDGVRMPQSTVAARLKDLSEVNLGFGIEQAMLEAQRCLSCSLCSECMQCVKACSANAVLHDQQADDIEIEVGSIILSPGIEEFPASSWDELGYGRYANILSSMQFERMLAATGPTGGCLQRPSDGGPVRKIAFIQCVGSRDPVRGNAYCSSVCCMSAAKEAIVAVEHSQSEKLEISVFCSDVRAFGKEFDSYINRASGEYGVKFVRAQASRITEVPDSKNLQISFSGQAGVEQNQEFDLVVLSVGTQVPASVKAMAARLKVDLNEFGFAQTQRFSPMTTTQPGIYVAGAFQEPKDIPESVAQGSAAAALAMSQLTAVRGTMIQHHEYPWERDVADEVPRIGVFVCQCGRNISSVIDVDRVANKAANMPNVHHAEVCIYTCSEATQQHIKSVIRKSRLNRLVVASCSSRTHEILFQETLRESGLNQYLFAMTNIRDQCSWVHRDDPAAATAKAIDLVSMAVTRARHLRAQPLYELPVTPSALVLGGGLAGMTAAQNIAGQGFRVHLVEREAALGGLLRGIHSSLGNGDIQKHLQQLIDKTRSDSKISVYLNSGLTRISGQAGNFTSIVNVAGKEIIVEHGAVIVATGGTERPTVQFFHGKNPRVMTQSKLESMLAGKRLLEELGTKKNPTVLMIQCVESRDEKNPYCSRVCCAEAVKNAIEIKQRLPQSRVIILGRDMRMYGFREVFYQKALEQGVQFVRYSDENSPEVVEKNGQLQVRVREVPAGADRVFDADLLVLSTGIAPAANNPALSTLLRSALNADGFFQEAHPKLRPVDLANEGEFLCGVAHSPRFMDETIAQAQAAAARASTILSKTQLEIMGRIAFVDPAECVACATCVKICPYGAPMINELRKSEIQSAKCVGCGNCVAACPARTITLQHQEGETMVAMLGDLLVGGFR
jgi:heterodisulfide reductase subunit A-like polyferredoxin